MSSGNADAVSEGREFEYGKEFWMGVEAGRRERKEEFEKKIKEAYDKGYNQGYSDASKEAAEERQMRAAESRLKYPACY